MKLCYWNKKIIKNLLIMAKELSLVTVAEGVETKEQADFLIEAGCDIAQGYYYAKPMPIEDFKQAYRKF
ncbi:MAG: EAL domain-containing protein [Anaerovorax sp.]